ncbi:MAG TPA: hypothetical protein VFT74_02590, partial [Isosphaeraceae bacterium]|nr:hypothetical protein [Isosphaeraceae bacterium]
MRLSRPRSPVHQQVMPFLDRHKRLERAFKRLILLGTLAVIVAVLALSAPLRLQIASTWDHLRIEAGRRIIGLQPTRAQVDVLIERRRAQTMRTTFNSVKKYYETLKTNYPRLRHLFDVMQLDPKHLLMVSGRPDNAFIVSPGTFERDHKGRIYRLKPNTHSLWVFRINYLGGPFGMFLVPDTPEVRQAAHEAEAAIDGPSLHTTNSWGVRGPEPNVNADLRGLVLGDSFMQGMFNGDQDTPPINLERTLRKYSTGSVSILNTGVIGYSPRQYYFT